MSQRIGRSTFRLDNRPSAVSYAAVGGKKEGEGPLARDFDLLCDDSSFGEQTWEKAESRLQKDAVNKALEKARLSTTDIDLIFAGDLLNQCVGSTYGLRDLEIPFLGLYGACSTMAESLRLARSSSVSIPCTCAASSTVSIWEDGHPMQCMPPATSTGASPSLICNSSPIVISFVITVDAIAVPPVLSYSFSSKPGFIIVRFQMCFKAQSPESAKF